MRCAACSFVLLLCILPLMTLAKLSDHIPLCKAKDPDVSNCVLKSGRILFQKVVHGIKEYGIPPVDPMYVPKLSLNAGDGPVGLNLTLLDTIHRGIGDLKMFAATAEPEKYYFDFNSTIDSYSMTGRYKVNGRILLLPIVGEGECNITLGDLNVYWVIRGKPVTRNGETYMRFTDYWITLNPKIVYLQLDNLFNGNKILGETMNTFINNNWEILYKELRPVFEETITAIFRSLAFNIFSTVPYNVMFSDP